MPPASEVREVREVPAGAGAPGLPGFEELYAAHVRDLTVQLYAYFGDRQEAQDVVQEAFLPGAVPVRRPGGLGAPGGVEPGHQPVAPGPDRATGAAPAAPAARPG